MRDATAPLFAELAHGRDHLRCEAFHRRHYIEMRDASARIEPTHQLIDFRRAINLLDPRDTLLDKLAGLVDAGKIRTTVAEHFGNINAANLKRAHALLETGKARGKIVLEGF